jgi:molybdopterin/thiamine biosynthesis adenylyltransferase/rhodanese-related sulfurtransferase
VARGDTKDAAVNLPGRYARQEVLAQVGPAGQRRLRGSRALVVGAGALGCPVLQYLAGAGLGCISVVDPDVVDRSNLHRQPLYGESCLGQPKVFAAREALHDLNPEVDLQALPIALDPDNAGSLVAQADVVVGCTDSFAASYQLSDACLAQGRPLICASVLGLAGYAGGFCATAPSLRAVFPELPATTATCATAGVLGPVAALLGCLQAQMALSVLLDLRPSPLGQMVVADLQAYGFRSFRFDGAGEPAEPPVPFIAAAGLCDGDLVIDLRSEQEAPVAVHPRAVRATVDTFRGRGLVPPAGQRVVMCCRTGLRAWRAASALRGYWQGPVALVAIGDVPGGTRP